MPLNEITGMQVNKWHNCYESGWKGIIVPEAFSHPAKMSYSLLKRILAHAKEQGWLKKGDVILDCFGGVGTTGILGAYEGYRVVCVELEQKFVDLAIQNFRLHDNAWSKLELPLPEILQGDSRRLCEIIEKADLIVSSPPFQETLNNAKMQVPHDSSGRFTKEYGQTPGQLGAMKLGNIDCILSSPPYAETMSSEKSGIDWSKIKRENGTPRDMSKEPAHKTRIGAGGEMRYGKTPGQLGSMKPGNVDMVISSPPYAESGGTPSLGSVNKDDWGKEGKDICGRRGLTAQYGDTEGNLGNLKLGDVDCVISSPPYAQSLDASAGEKVAFKKTKTGITRPHYAPNIENLGNQQGDTFWQAAKLIVEQCFQILKPGGHAIWVVKSFVREKKIVDFPGDWQRLCESVGFKTVCIRHAMLVKETEHKTLFGHTEVKRKERKSFFRRLAESKGSPRIDYEVVLCMETPKRII